LEEIVMNYLEENNVLGDVQGAFRKGRRTEDHIFTLQGICSIRKSKKCKTYLAFFDLSKALDRVWSSANSKQLIISDANSIPTTAFFNTLTKSFIRTEKRVGERTHPCFNPNSWSKNSVSC
jgi:hypothetical protein